MEAMQDSGTLAGRVAGLERELAGRRERIEQLERELDQARIELAERRGEADALTRGLSDAEARLEAASRELNARHAEVERLRKERAKHRKLLSQTHRTADELKAMEDERLTQLGDEIDRLKRAARTKDKELSARNRELDAARNAIHEMEPRLRATRQLAQDRWIRLQKLEGTRWWRFRTRLSRIRRWRPGRKAEASDESDESDE